jgi:hypothetical protein
MNETQEILLNLIDHAAIGEHTKFEQLRFFSEYLGGRVVYNSVKKVVTILKAASKDVFKLYCKTIVTSQTDVNMLLAYKQLQLAIDFYKEEQKILKAILKDYEKYFWEGDFLKNLILGKERDIWNLP